MNKTCHQKALAHALFFVINAMLLSVSGVARAADDFIVSRAFLEDKSGTLTIDHVIGREFSPMGKILTKGYTDSVFWLRLKITVPQQGGELVLRINPSFLDEVKLFEPDPTLPGNWLMRVVGDRYPFDQRDWYSIKPGFVIHPAAGESTVYLRMKTSSSSLLSVVALPPQAAQLQATRQFALDGLYLGIMLWFLFWASNDYFANRDRFMAHFILYQVSSILYFVCRQGYIALCVPGGFPELADYLTSTVISATSFFAALFHRTLLRHYAPSRIGLYGMSALMLIFPFQWVAIWSNHTRYAMHANTLFLLLLAFYAPLLVLTARAESTSARRMIFAIYSLNGLVLLISVVPLLGWVEIKGEWNIHAALAQVLISDFLIFLLLWQRVKQRNIQYQQAVLSMNLTEQQLNIERARREEQGRFMAMLSHELKTPLAVMRMSLGTQLDGQPPDKKRMRVEKALEEVNAIVERCLQVDKLEQRNTLVRLENCRLQKILEEIRLVSAVPAGVEMQIAALPMIKTDIQLLRVILVNLVDNALKYAALESPVQVSAQVQHKDDISGVCVAVENTPGSAGMPDPERVFSKYYRSPGAHRKTGSGLGLYLVHSMTALLGGEIVYRPGPDKVRFELWLPQGA